MGKSNRAFDYDDLPEVDDRYNLGECIGTGVFGKVYIAKDTEAGGKKVAVKIQRYNRDTAHYVQEEYRILRDFSHHPNLPDFYGIFRRNDGNEDEVWFSMELCELGPVIDLVNGMISKNRRVSEEHIAFIIKEVAKALVFLHENHIMHRDIKGSNILLTKEGEIKLVDYGLSRMLSSTLGKTDSLLGSPCWMAPEVVASTETDEDSGYGNRADVWALGITAIELADGKAPFQDMHPTRAMFQIVRNPPPTLYRPANWSEEFNDFINECLVKNPEHRPFIIEVMEHPFLETVPENSYHINQELKALMEQMGSTGKEKRQAECTVHSNFLKKSRNQPLERMHVEDLAALDIITEDAIIQELYARMKAGQFHSFIGDILLIVNPNERMDIYGEEYHRRHMLKSRSDNAPHIYSVADSAYQDALHHEMTQHILLTGESGSGKTTNFLHLVDHLLFLGYTINVSSDRIKDGIKLIHALIHATTPMNDYSTRGVMRTEITFGKSGKTSGAMFQVQQIEKWRVSGVDMDQSNFHIFYYFYDGLADADQLSKYMLNENRSYRYMRIPDSSRGNRPRDNPEDNVRKFKKIKETMKKFEFSDKQIEAIFTVLAAILNLGDVRFLDTDKGVAEIENPHVASKVAQLLEVDEKKFIWSLTNYCFINKGTAVRKRHTSDEARDARDVLANTLYLRLVDYIICNINHKLSVGRAIFGDKYSVKILDLYGFECFTRNHIPQLLINCLNEQLHYHFLQRIFAWEAIELTEEEVPIKPIHYYDNKSALDMLLSKCGGILHLIDEASRQAQGGEYITGEIRQRDNKFARVSEGTEFLISHYTGTVSYDAKEMPDRNLDFLPPEVIETLRLSKNPIFKQLFRNKLTKTGNLVLSFEDAVPDAKRPKASSSSDEETSTQQNSQNADGNYSQIRKMRTATSTFRALCLELLKELSVGGGAGGVHFVLCVRSDLQETPKGFHKEIVKQQLRALNVLETAKARQRGFPHRIPFPEFIRRYKFLAFDFDENVEVTKDNCRLLLVRLKMEGWLIGKSKVFLKYYNEEYLSRLYETQVKKVIKVQSMIRSYLAKRRIAKKGQKSLSNQNTKEMSEDEAAVVLQKAYRGMASRKAYGPLVSKQSSKVDKETSNFIQYYCKKWRAKTIFQVLLQYRAARFQDLFNLSQQIHLFNQSVVNDIQKINYEVDFDCIDSRAQVSGWLGRRKPSVLKMPFRLEDIPFFDTVYLCDPSQRPTGPRELDEPWDAPLRRKNNVSSQIINSSHGYSLSGAGYDENQRIRKPSVDKIIFIPYNRNPEEPIRRLSNFQLDNDHPIIVMSAQFIPGRRFGGIFLRPISTHIF
ncbi:neither inactivation nor afterpotential protein C isoform X2 [Agrilus planipennis]|uniref:non-specific serine/threonine protein kinase n=1 Tax=Agrilus planipennis TaxID=224129 RepID=A0A1W4WXA5_AGRPL|nr:neither inactivation nor afterpotential protein C isoform X2 [Agrilus planipennis]